jgi:hypothetical protein
MLIRRSPRRSKVGAAEVVVMEVVEGLLRPAAEVAAAIEAVAVVVEGVIGLGGETALVETGRRPKNDRVHLRPRQQKIQHGLKSRPRGLLHRAFPRLPLPQSWRVLGVLVRLPHLQLKHLHPVLLLLPQAAKTEKQLSNKTTARWHRLLLPILWMCRPLMPRPLPIHLLWLKLLWLLLLKQSQSLELLFHQGGMFGQQKDLLTWSKPRSNHCHLQLLHPKLRRLCLLRLLLVSNQSPFSLLLFQKQLLLP